MAKKPAFGLKYTDVCCVRDKTPVELVFGRATAAKFYSDAEYKKPFLRSPVRPPKNAGKSPGVVDLRSFGVFGSVWAPCSPKWAIFWWLETGAYIHTIKEPPTGGSKEANSNGNGQWAVLVLKLELALLPKP